MKQVTLPLDLVNATLNYLATKPYGEVVELIAAIKTAAETSLADEANP